MPVSVLHQFPAEWIRVLAIPDGIRAWQLRLLTPDLVGTLDVRRLQEFVCWGVRAVDSAGPFASAANSEFLTDCAVLSVNQALRLASKTLDAICCATGVELLRLKVWWLRV